MMKNKRNGTITLFISLFIFWVILSSRLQTVQMIVGLIATGLIVLYSMDLIFSKDETSGITFKTFFRLILLGLTLIKEVVKANVGVVKIVLSPKMKLHQGFKTIRQPLKKELNQALYGNAITLTPGTLTIGMTKDEIIVHGLLIENIDAIEGSPLQRAFIKLEDAE